MQHRPGTLHILCGYIGAGKTTFARRLEAQTRGIRLNTDLVMVNMFGINPPHETYLANYRGVERILRHYAKRTLALGIDTIFDYGFWNRANRDDIRAFAADCHAPLKMYYVTAPDNIMRQRATTRDVAQDNETVEITLETWDKLRPLFEPPQPDEVFTIVNGTVENI